jgi:site-specific recombinase XerD
MILSIKVHSKLDYQQLCDELGISLEDLKNIQKFKQMQESNQISIEDTSPLITDIIPEFNTYILKLNKNKKRADSTIKTYSNFLSRLEKYVEEHIPLLTIQMLNEELLMDMLKGSNPRKGENLSINTYNKYQSILRKIIFFCYDKGYLNKDLRYRFPIQNRESLPRYLTLNQLKVCLNKALQRTYGYRCRAIVIFLAGTGCRVSELVNMRVKDFNIEEKIIFVKNGKGNKDRIIPMFNEVEKAITHYLKLSGLPEWNPSYDGYLFCRDEGDKREKNITVDSVQYLVRSMFSTMNLSKDYTVHSFRHTFAVNCLKAGINLQYITQMLGHNDPKTTQVYLKLLPNDLKEVVMKNYPLPFENLLRELF